MGAQGLNPSPGWAGGFSRTLSALQTPNPLSSLLLLPWDPNPRQRSPSRRKKEVENVLTSVPPSPRVYLSSSVILALAGPSWVLCEHSDFRGRQWLVGSCEITNWLTYSGTQRVGSLYPIKQVSSVSGGACLSGYVSVCFPCFPNSTCVCFCHNFCHIIIPLEPLLNIFL